MGRNSTRIKLPESMLNRKRHIPPPDTACMLDKVNHCLGMLECPGVARVISRCKLYRLTRKFREPGIESKYLDTKL